MAQFVTPEVEDRLERADEQSELKVVIVPARGQTDQVKTRTQQYDVKIERVLPSKTLLVTGLANEVSEFIETDDIGSVSEPNRAEILQ
jgi:hypothetical protein